MSSSGHQRGETMRRMWFAVAVLAAVLSVRQSGAAQVRAVDAERLLAGRFAFTPDEIAQARGGKPVSKLLPSQAGTDVGVLAAVRIAGSPDRLAAWLKDIVAFRK